MPAIVTENSMKLFMIVDPFWLFLNDVKKSPCSGAKVQYDKECS